MNSSLKSGKKRRFWSAVVFIVLEDRHVGFTDHLERHVLRRATNADCRLADWQVIEVNIVVECFNRFSTPKL